MNHCPLYSVQLVREKTVKYEPEACGDAGAAVAAIRGIIGMADRESLVALFVSARNRIVGAHVITMGNGSGLNADTPQVFRAAIVAGARAIILGHNHPSGDPTPSREDLAFTMHTMKAGKLLGIPVLDHVIIAEGASYSAGRSRPGASRR
jgi:DNA repair protein RadC